MIEGMLLTEAVHRLSYSGFKQLVRDNKVESIVLTQNEMSGRLKEAVEIKGRTTRLFTTVRVDDPDLVQLLDGIGQRRRAIGYDACLHCCCHWH